MYTYVHPIYILKKNTAGSFCNFGYKHECIYIYIYAHPIYIWMIDKHICLCEYKIAEFCAFFSSVLLVVMLPCILTSCLTMFCGSKSEETVIAD